MQINTRKENESILVVAINGRLDATSSPVLEAELRSLLDQQAKDLVLNLTGLEYISSAGLRVLISVAKLLKSRSGSLSLCCMAAPVREVFDIAGFTPVFQVLPSESEAIQAVKPAG